MKHRYDTIVIGGGVIGTSIAFHLAKRRKKVLLIEKTDLASGASGACDQQIILQSKNPGVHLKLALKSAELYPEISKEIDHDIEYRHCGGMILIETQEEMPIMHDFVERQRQTGLQVEILPREDAVKFQPGLAAHILGATYSPQDAEVNPMEVTFGFAKVAKKFGTEILLETEATGLIMHHNRVEGVLTGKGTFYADTVINAAGAWAPEIGRMAGLNIPITPRRGQIVITEPFAPFLKHVMLSAQYIVAKFHPDILKNASNRARQLGVGLALSQSQKGNILIGATREFVGYDTHVTYNGMKEILKNAARLVPPLKELNIIRVMAGLRPYTPDGLPLIGWVNGLEGFFMAAGHEGDGIALSPVTGKIVSELICERSTFVDMSPFDPNRFQL
jgi:sarcosine oxidase subunit beta